jgi:hypothetical protein
VNRTRFWVEPLNCLGYLAINMLRPEFARNVALRRALNWAVDRRAALASLPPYSGSPWTHLLPPGSPGSITAPALTAIGFKDGDVKLKGFGGADLYAAMGKHNTDLDLGVRLGVCSDYPSPFGPFGVVGLKASYRAKLAAAERLHGAARLRALGELDLAITNTLAPVVVMRTYDNRYFFSGRVEPRSLVYQSAYQDWSIPALALK